MMGLEENKELIRRYTREVFDQGGSMPWIDIWRRTS